MLKLERKIDVKDRTVYQTLKYYIANYSNATKGNATFYYIKANHTKDKGVLLLVPCQDMSWASIFAPILPKLEAMYAIPSVT